VAVVFKAISGLAGHNGTVKSSKVHVPKVIYENFSFCHTHNPCKQLSGVQLFTLD